MARARGTDRFVALFRGINVGGKNKLPMAALTPLFADAGAGDIRTYIQSGNVLFTASLRAVDGIVTKVERAVAERFGLRVPIVLRSAVELGRIATEHPFFARDVDPKLLHVVFLADAPSARAVASLDGERSPPDRFQVVGREIYLHLPNGAGRSRLTNDYFDRTLGTLSTARNWRTVLTLAELARD